MVPVLVVVMVHVDDYGKRITKRSQYCSVSPCTALAVQLMGSPCANRHSEAISRYIHSTTSRSGKSWGLRNKEAEFHRHVCRIRSRQWYRGQQPLYAGDREAIV